MQKRYKQRTFPPNNNNNINNTFQCLFFLNHRKTSNVIQLIINHCYIAIKLLLNFFVNIVVEF